MSEERTKRSFSFSTFLNLHRSLFPRWDFFDQISYTFVIEARAQGQEQWTRFNLQAQRSIKDLFFNPHLNLILAQSNLLDHFAMDLQEGSAIEGQTSFRLVKQLAKNLLEEKRTAEGQYEFRIFAKGKNKTEILFQSQLLPWKEMP